MFEDHPELILRNIRDGPISATVEMVALETGATVLSDESQVDPVDHIEWQLDLTETTYRISTTLQDGSSKSRRWTWGEQSNYMDIVVWDEEIEYMERAY